MKMDVEFKENYFVVRKVLEAQGLKAVFTPKLVSLTQVSHFTTMHVVK